MRKEKLIEYPPSEIALLVASVGVAVIATVVAAGINQYLESSRTSEPIYPRVQEENELFRLAKLAPGLARVTLFGEPATEEQRDVLWREIFTSLQRDKPISCSWTLSGIVHENPPSYITKCEYY